jgi:hypothetical protein
VLVDGEAAEPVGLGAVLLHAAEDVAGHGCSSDREGRATEEYEEEQEGARRVSGGGGSGRGNAHALVVEEDCEVWPLAV